MFRNDKEGRLLDIQFKKVPFLKIFPCFDISWFLNCLPCLKCFPCFERMQTLLKVPTLLIDDGTEIRFRNLMALEQCHYPSESYICNYVVLLDCLIDTSEDVDLLVKEEIIANALGSNEEVANMVNKLSHEIVEKNSCYDHLAQDLYRHYNQGCNHNMASLRSIYFANVWRGTTTIVGLIVFGFTFWNTIRPYVIKQIQSIEFELVILFSFATAFHQWACLPYSLYLGTGCLKFFIFFNLFFMNGCLKCCYGIYEEFVFQPIIKFYSLSFLVHLLQTF